MKLNDFLKNTEATIMSNGFSHLGDKGEICSLFDVLNDHYNKSYINVDKHRLPCMFRWTTGLHEARENLDVIIENYNGIFTIDIDSPKDENGDKIWTAEYTNALYYNIHKNLSNKCKHYLFSELSSSFKGIHLMFGVTKEKWTIEDYCLFGGYCLNCIYKCLTEIGFDENEIVGTKNIITSTGQMLDGTCMQITRKYFYGYFTNIFSNGDFDSEEEWEYECLNKIIDNTVKKQIADYTHTVVIDTETEYEITLKNNISAEPVEYGDDYASRIKLASTLLRLCKNKKLNEDASRTQALNIYENMRDLIWARLDDARKMYVNEKMLKIINTLRFDKVYVTDEALNVVKKFIDIEIFDENCFVLDDGQFLSDIINDIEFKDGINLLISGTGTGKTECWKYLTRFDPLNPTICKILVCEPYISIIESKYDRKEHYLSHGSVVIDENYDIDLTVSNYNKINKITAENAKKLDYIVIDESHLLFAEPYRWDTTNKFVRKIIELSKYCKIILQTATPAFEREIFNINKANVFTIKKKNPIKTTIEYRNVFGSTVGNAVMFAKHYLKNDMADRVFIYNGSGGVNDDLTLEYGEYKTVVYHKKNDNKEGIEYIDAHHKMGDYKILISSCWFGVGHDLNDDDRCLVIICGNLPYHEEAQAVGRFRKAKSVQVLILCNEYNYHDNYYKSQDTLKHYYNKISTNNTFNAVIVSKDMTGHLHDEFDVKFAWYIWKYMHMMNNYGLKKKMYKEFGWKFYEPLNIKRKLDECDNCNIKAAFNIRSEPDLEKIGDYKIMLKTGEYKRNTQNHKKGDERLEQIGRIHKNKCGTYDSYYKYFPMLKRFDTQKRQEINARICNKKEEIFDKITEGRFSDDDYNELDNKFKTITKWAHLVNGLYKYHRDIFDMLLNECKNGKFKIINYITNVYDCLYYIDKIKTQDYDKVEYYIIKYIVGKMQCFAENGVDYALLYVVWCLYSNKGDKNIKAEYLSGFKKMIDLCRSIYISSNVYDALCGSIKTFIKNDFYDYFFEVCEKHIADEGYDNFIEHVTNGVEFVVTDGKLLKSSCYAVFDVNKMYNEANEIFKCNDKFDVTYDEIIKNLDEHIRKINYNESRKAGGKIAGQKRKKAAKITDKMPEKIRRKYNLAVGEQFESRDRLSQKTGISLKNVTEWRRKGYIL